MRTYFREAPPLRQRLALAVLACIALAACQPQTNVATTGNVPAKYAHVWITLEKVAFNASATAGPADSGWQQLTLPSPQTVDLAALTNGLLAQFASQLALSQGTYNQMRVVLTDSSTALTSSARAAGADFNDEVDYTDASGTLHRLPLQVPSAAAGIAFAVNLTVASSQQTALAALACAASSSSTGSLGNAAAVFGGSGSGGFGSFGNCAFGGQTKADCVSGQFYDHLLGSCINFGSSATLGTTTSGTTGFGATSFGTTSTAGCAAGTTLNPATGTCVAATNANFASTCSFNQTYNPATGTCSSALNMATTDLAVDFDASRDIVPFSVSGQPGFLLIPHLTGYNLTLAGSIAGSVNVSAVPASAGGIEVTAETLSADGSRHVIVESAPLGSDGSFLLYPLPATTSTATTATGATSCPSGETYNPASGTCEVTAATTSQYDLVIHGPGIATVIVTGVPVTAGKSSSSIALGITLTPATPFPVELAADNPVSPAGAYVGFYQTIPGTGEVPYLIEAYPIDPFIGAFDSAQYLSEADIEYGSYVSGGSVALTIAPPSEGSVSYAVGASAPLYGDGPLSTVVTGPMVATTTPTTFTVAAIPLPSGTSADSVSGTLTVATPGRYDKGELVLTHNGALVAATPIDADLGVAQTSATFFGSVPGGGGTASTGQYYLEAWVWSSADPAGTFTREPFSSLVDLTSGSASNVAVTIN